MSRWIPLHLLGALALCLLAPAARASTVRALDVPALTRGSDQVIQGRVLRATSHPLQGTGRIVTGVEVAVDEVLVGPGTPPSVHVTLPGGAVGDLRQHVSGAPELAPGEEVVLFLARGTEGLRVVGLAQGVFRVQRSEEGRKVLATAVLPEELRLVDPLSLQPVAGTTRTMDLQELRARVLAAARDGASPAPRSMSLQALETQASIPPYSRSHTPASEGAEGLCLWWPGGNTLTFQQQQCMPGEADCAARQAAVALALRSWDDVLTECASLRVSEGPVTASRQVGYVLNGANENLLVLRDRACTQPGGTPEGEDCWRYAAETLALTTVTFQQRTGQVLDADVEINAVAFASPAEARDLQGTVTHELGHALGLDHSADARSTMYPTATPDQRRVDEGSRQAMCTIYPRGAPAVDCVAREPGADPQPLGPWGCNAATGGGGSLLSGWVALLGLRRRRQNVR